MQTPTPRHVLFLNWRDTANPEGGGSEVYVERVAAELVARGHRATILCAAHSHAPADETNSSGVRIIRRGGRHTVYLRAALTYLGGWFGLGRLGRGGYGRPDVIVDVCNGLPFLTPLYSRRPVVVLLHHVHREQWPVVLPDWRAKLGWWIESKLSVRVYRRRPYVTVSEATRAELVSLGVAAERIAVIHNGTPRVPTVPEWRTVNPSLVILCRLVPHKQVEVALRTVGALAAELPTLELVVAGQGWWEPALRALTADLGIADRVRFVGFVDERHKAELLGSAWVALTPSMKEGWGLTIVEAGAMGTPTVAFRGAGGVAEALIDGRTGWLADDLDGFVARVRELLTDEIMRKSMGEAARAHAAAFTWTATADAFETLVLRAAR